MLKKRTLNFHETLDYQYATLFGKEGLYLPMVVSLDKLQDDIFYYYILKNRHTGSVSISLKQERRTTGMFFSKEELEIKGNRRHANMDDFIMKEKLTVPEEFFSFFQVKLSLDQQITVADVRRKEDIENNEDDVKGLYS